jgi:hypothetical protein
MALRTRLITPEPPSNDTIHDKMDTMVSLLHAAADIFEYRDSDSVDYWRWNYIQFCKDNDLEQ